MTSTSMFCIVATSSGSLARDIPERLRKVHIRTPRQVTSVCKKLPIAGQETHPKTLNPKLQTPKPKTPKPLNPQNPLSPKPSSQARVHHQLQKHLPVDAVRCIRRHEILLRFRASVRTSGLQAFEGIRVYGSLGFIGFFF